MSGACYTNVLMPELPEVETIRRGLEEHLVGLTLTAIHIHLPKIFVGETNQVIGGAIIAVRRFGKGLVIDLSHGFSLTIHVKMTGQLIFEKHVYPPVNIHIAEEKTSQLPNKYTHVIFTFRDRGGKDATLFFNDIRQFGWIKVVPTLSVHEAAFFKQLGKEPLRDLTQEEFSTLLSKSKAPIKQLIMDQQKIAGIGNIYANDALWDSRIHPLRPANSLSQKERESLFHSIEKVLSLGIEVGGASERDYVNILGEKGGYQNHFLVYKQTGKPCKRCGTSIERIVVGGRGTFVCWKCQIV
jgi:formamidopyrimidine-DNA glycosylase